MSDIHVRDLLAIVKHSAGSLFAQAARQRPAHSEFWLLLTSDFLFRCGLHRAGVWPLAVLALVGPYLFWFLLRS